MTAAAIIPANAYSSVSPVLLLASRLLLEDRLLMLGGFADVDYSRLP